jgi:hypothetical protein
VDTVQHGEHVRRRALHAQRQPGDPAGAKSRQRGRGDRLRVGLDRDLDSGGKTWVDGQGLDDA